MLYISTELSLHKFTNIFDYFLGVAFAGGKISQSWMLTATPSGITYIVVTLFVILLIYSIFNIIRKKELIALPFILTYLYEAGLHLFYGNGELVLYTIESSFLLLIILIFGIKNSHDKLKLPLIILISTILALSFGQTLFSCICTLNYLHDSFGLARRGFLASYKLAANMLLFAILLFVLRNIRFGEKIDNKKILNIKLATIILAFSIIILINFVI